MGSGTPAMKSGLSISQYSFTKSMTADNLSMYTADGDLLLVQEKGTLLVTTELGRLRVEPKEVLILPRGVKFSVDLEGGEGRGWMAECFSGHF